MLCLLVWFAAIRGLRNKSRWLAGPSAIRLVFLMTLLAAWAIQELYALCLITLFAVMQPYCGIGSCGSLGRAAGQRLVFLILDVQLPCLYGYLRQRKARKKQDSAA